MSRGIKYVREGYAEGGRIPVYGREGDIAYYIDAPPETTSQSQPIASFASPVTRGTLTMPEAPAGVYAGHYVPGRPDRAFSPFGFADYARGSQANPFAQLAGLRSPEFIPIQSTRGRGYESIYGANLPEGRFDVSADPGVSVTPLTAEEKVNYLRQVAAALAPVTNISNVAYGGAGGQGGAGGSTGPVTATGGTSSATGGAGGSTGPVTATGGTSSATGGAGGTSSVGNVSGGTSSVGNVTGGTSSVGNVSGGSSSVGNVTGGTSSVGNVAGGSSSSTVGNVAGGSATLGDVVNTAAGGTSTATGTGGTSTATGTGGTSTATGTGTATPTTGTGPTGETLISEVDNGNGTVRRTYRNNQTGNTRMATERAPMAPTGTAAGAGTGTSTGTAGGTATAPNEIVLSEVRNSTTGALVRDIYNPNTGARRTEVIPATPAPAQGTGTGGFSAADTQALRDRMTGGTPSPITTSLPTPAYEYGGRTYSSYADLLKAIDDDVAARRAQQSATLSDLGRGSEADSGGGLRDIDLPGDVRSDLPPERGPQAGDTARPADPGDATGLGAGREPVTSGELTPDEATLRAYDQITREQEFNLKDEEALRNLEDVLRSTPAAQLPGDEILAGGSGEEGLTGTSSQAVSPADRIAQDVMGRIGAMDPSVAANMGVRGEYDPNAPNASALQGLAAAIGAAAPFSGIGIMGAGTPVVGGTLGLIGSGVMDQLGLSRPSSPVLSAALNPIGTAAGALLGEEGRKAVDAQFTRETAEMARSYADQVLSGNMSPSMAATAAAQDLGSVGRLGAVLDAIDQAAQIQGAQSSEVGSPGGYDGGGFSSAGGLGFEGEGAGGNWARGGHINMSHLVDHIKRQVRKDLARGGYVPGHSGGMDDDVPAVIDGRRPARLSSGEFVFDAATVAALGDGNNAAGAKKLNQLRHAIRQKAYGHRRQPPKNYSLGDLVGMA